MVSNIIYKFYKLGVKLASHLGIYGLRQREYLTICNHLISKMKKSKRLQKHIAVADLGCGHGCFVSILSKFYDVVGLDVKHYKLWARKRGEFIVGDARQLPFRSRSLDVILTLSLLEHINEWDLVIREIFRVLKPKGLYILQLPNLKHFIEPHTKAPLLFLMPDSIKKS